MRLIDIGQKRIYDDRHKEDWVDFDPKDLQIEKNLIVVTSKLREKKEKLESKKSNESLIISNDNYHLNKFCNSCRFNRGFSNSFHSKSSSSTIQDSRSSTKLSFQDPNLKMSYLKTDKLTVCLLEGEQFHTVFAGRKETPKFNPENMKPTFSTCIKAIQASKQQKNTNSVDSLKNDKKTKQNKSSNQNKLLKKAINHTDKKIQQMQQSRSINNIELQEQNSFKL